MSRGKPGPKPSNNVTLPLRMSPMLKEAAERVAEATGRSVSALAGYALQRYIEHNYPAAFRPGATLTHLKDAPSK